MEKLTNKEILISYCSTLSENKCKIAYQALQERFEITRKKNMLFNREGVEALAPEGKIRLTPNQFKMILEVYGEQGFHRLCELLYDYIVNLEERAPFETVAKQRLKNYNSISHYYKLTRGWVAERYEQECQRDNKYSAVATMDENKFLNFEDIKSKLDAITYIKSIPSHLRYDNVEISYLYNEYGLVDEDIS